MISSAAKTLTLPDFQSDCRALYACRMSFAKFAEEKIPEISAIQDAFAVRAHAIQPNAGTGAFSALTDEQKSAELQESQTSQSKQETHEETGEAALPGKLPSENLLPERITSEKLMVENLLPENLPAFAEKIEELHRKSADSPAVFELIGTHCKIVAEMTLFVCKNYACKNCDCKSSVCRNVSDSKVSAENVNAALAFAGALAHDIGAYELVRGEGTDENPIRYEKNYVRHGILGYNLLKNAGFDEQIALFARNHTGVGLTKKAIEAQNIPIPSDDYVPVTREQQIVMFCDKFHTKSLPPKFVTAKTAVRRCAKFSEKDAQKMSKLVEIYGEPPVEALARKYSMTII